MRPTLYTVDLPGAGRVSTMAKPRGGDWLPDEMTALKAADVDVLVCALTPAELREADLDNEPHAARQAGLSFTHVPIPDRTVPDLNAVLPTLHHLTQRLHDSTNIVIHCRFGIGRSSLLAVSLLILNGTDPETAWAQFQTARGIPVPDTAEQRIWPTQLIEHRPA
ncbi:protein-tyrosine phosphatase family protein [Actinomadura viridis]|uniref:protein-tyrosine phosphatase family protein n=1 Tax=Actinomadura viridis TaxID=58110 RepID=UPI0036796C8A